MNRRGAVVTFVIAAAAVAGCVTPLAMCPGSGGATRIALTAAEPAVQADIHDLLEARIRCGDASYDPTTQQARWAYWVELTPRTSTTAARGYDIHLTRLDRRVINRLLTDPTGDTRAATLQEFKLDVLRADLHIAAGSGLSFPCAEVLTAPQRLGTRARAGAYTVERIYTGEVILKGQSGNDLRFVPVQVRVEMEFVLPAPGTATPEDARRQPEWVGLSGQCETCKPLVICESLHETTAFRPVSPSSSPPPYVASGSHVHLLAGLEKRPVVVDSVLAERKRTLACTRWSPVGSTHGTLVLVRTDSTDETLAAAAPYLTVHHAAELSPGSWTVELRLAEAVDEVPGKTQAAIDACRDGTPVFHQAIVVP